MSQSFEDGDEPFEEFEEDFDYVDNDADAVVVVRSTGPSGTAGAAASASSTAAVSFMPDTLFAEIKGKIQALAEVLNWSADAAALVLPHFSWSNARAQEAYFDDPASVMRVCGVRENDIQSSALAPNVEVVECLLCWDDVPPGGALALRCSHWFCVPCWEEHLRHTVEAQGVSVLPTKRCPQAQCAVPCGMGEFEQIFAAKLPHLWEKYKRFVTKSFVDSAADYNFCPSPTCDAIVHATLLRTPECQEVRCDRCQGAFCFKCLQEPHAPAECEMLQKWQQKERDDSETVNWLVVNTRPCPKCRRVTEKNGGCNHMKCAQCSFDWCWVCGQEWDKHGSSWYKCNFYDESKNQETKWQKDSARMELEKYIFYYTRYQNHDKSSKLEQKLLQTTRDRIREQLQRSVGPFGDTEYLERTARVLIRCRRVLKHSYIYAFYLTDRGKKDLFEYNQNMLEYHTELLSEYIEDRTGKHEHQEIVNRTAVAESMLKKLEEGIFQGA